MLSKTKKAVISAIGGGLLATSMAANAIVVGGIDFGATGGYPDQLHFETATLAQTLIDGNGQSVTSYGQITTVNGDTSYCAVGNCTLYYVATFNNSAGFTESSGTAVSFNSANINIYLADDPLPNLLTNPGGSPANVAAIQGLSEWVRFTNHGDIHGTGNLVGSANIGGSVNGLYDVDTSDTFGIATVAAFLNADTIPNGGGLFADIDITASFSNIPGRLNRFDDAVVDRSCFNGTAGQGDWCFGGTADIAGGTVIPAPATLALLGLGLIGLGLNRRK